MKKGFNKADVTDSPLDAKASNTSSSAPKKSSTKPKITKIGGDKPKSTTTKSTASKSSTSKTATSRSNASATSKTETSKKSTTDTTKKTSKLADKSVKNKELEKINEEQLNTRGYRGTRNKVIIISLVVLIVISIIGVILYSLTMKSDANCFLYLSKPNDVDAHYVVNNQNINEFRTPSALREGVVYDLDIELKISTPGQYNIKYYYECYVNGALTDCVLNYELDWDMFRRDDATNTYYTIQPVDGNATIKLTGGLAIQSDYVNRISTQNFRMRIFTIIEKV